MKFQWTKHKKLWDKLANTNEIQKCYETLLKSDEDFDGDDVLREAKGNLIGEPYITCICYACDYTDKLDKPCTSCPLFSTPCSISGPYVDLCDSVESQDWERVQELCEVIRDLPVKPGVDYE